MMMRGLPEPFYQPAVVKEVYRRYDAARGRVELTQHLHSRVGKYNALAVLSYLDEANSRALYV